LCIGVDDGFTFKQIGKFAIHFFGRIAISVVVPKFGGDLGPHCYELFSDVVCDAIIRGVRSLRDVEDVAGSDLGPGQEFLNEFTVEVRI